MVYFRVISISNSAAKLFCVVK